MGAKTPDTSGIAVSQQEQRWSRCFLWQFKALLQTNSNKNLATERNKRVIVAMKEISLGSLDSPTLLHLFQLITTTSPIDS